MASDLDLIREIQQIDQRIEELEKELAQLPIQVAEIESKLEAHKKDLADQKAALEANESERRRLEGEASDWEQKATRLQAQISQAKTNEQYRAFRNEITFARKEIKQAEDVTLDKMEEAEALTEKIAVAEKALAEEAATVGAEVEEFKGRFKGDEENLAQVQAERRDLANRIPPKLLRAYDLVKRKLRKSAVWPMLDDRCSSCNMVIRPQVRHDLKVNNDDVITCEFCGCILYWDDPQAVTVEDPAGEAGAV